MWFKKKAQIAKENGNIPVTDLANAAPDGTDFRTSGGSAFNTSLVPGLPSPEKMGNYFYLPALGRYAASYFLQFNGVTFSRGFYWSSTTDYFGHSLFFQNGYAGVNFIGVEGNAYPVLPFE